MSEKIATTIEPQQPAPVRSSAWLGRIRRVETIDCPDVATEMIRAGWRLLSAGRKDGSINYCLGSTENPHTAGNAQETVACPTREAILA